MTIVRINAIHVPDGAGNEIEKRFAARLGSVDDQPGFLGFELLRPTGDNEERYFVVTHWADVASFDAWVESTAFRSGHAETDRKPVASGADLLEFDVVLSTRAHT